MQLFDPRVTGLRRPAAPRTHWQRAISSVAAYSVAALALASAVYNLQTPRSVAPADVNPGVVKALVKAEMAPARPEDVALNPASDVLKYEPAELHRQMTVLQRQRAALDDDIARLRDQLHGRNGEGKQTILPHPRRQRLERMIEEAQHALREAQRALGTS